jgi:hypothetical protein
LEVVIAVLAATKKGVVVMVVDKPDIKLGSALRGKRH